MKNLTRSLIMLITIPTLPVTNAFGYSQLGYGGTRCSLYNSMQSKNMELIASVDSWALGYLSGLNQAKVTVDGEGFT